MEFAFLVQQKAKEGRIYLKKITNHIDKFYIINGSHVSVAVTYSANNRLVGWTLGVNVRYVTITEICNLFCQGF